jgi:hypothetical protein
VAAERGKTLPATPDFHHKTVETPTTALQADQMVTAEAQPEAALELAAAGGTRLEHLLDASTASPCKGAAALAPSSLDNVPTVATDSETLVSTVVTAVAVPAGTAAAEEADTLAVAEAQTAQETAAVEVASQMESSL